MASSRSNAKPKVVAKAVAKPAKVAVKAKAAAQVDEKPVSKSIARLARKKDWLKPEVDAAFHDHKSETVGLLAEVIAQRNLLRTGVAYKTLRGLLFQLVEHPKLDPSPLFSLLEPIVRYPTYDPDKLRQFELMRTYSMRLFARAKHPALRPMLVHWLESFPERFDQQSGSRYLFALAEIANDLGDKTLAPLFEPLIDRMLPAYDERQRESALGATRELVAKLARKK